MVDQPTEAEKNIVNLHDNVMFSSSYAAKIFKSVGCENVKYLPIGFDPDFFTKLIKNILKEKFILV